MRSDGKGGRRHGDPAALTVTTLDHLVLNVREVEVSAAWYHRVIGMEREDFRVSSGGRIRTCMRFGAKMLKLRPVDAGQDEWFTALYPAAGNHDLCFLTEYAPQAVRRHLAACGVEIVTGPGIRRGARGDIVSVYCRDPDGNLVEISSYGAEPEPEQAE